MQISNIAAFQSATTNSYPSKLVSEMVLEKRSCGSWSNSEPCGGILYLTKNIGSNETGPTYTSLGLEHGRKVLWGVHRTRRRKIQIHKHLGNRGRGVVGEYQVFGGSR